MYDSYDIYCLGSIKSHNYMDVVDRAKQDARAEGAIFQGRPSRGTACAKTADNECTFNSMSIFPKPVEKVL